MNPLLREVASHMRDLATGALAHALRHALYSSRENPWWSQLSVLNAAHAAELFVKARIAQEHPLLIFSQLPRVTQGVTDQLDFVHLFRNGRTFQYSELPDRLWAVTGMQLSDPQAFLEFGKLRNMIQHFAAPNSDTSQATLEFVFGVLDPFINAEWGLFAIDYNEEYGDHYDHVLDTLVRRDIRPLISPRAARVWSSPSFQPGPNAPPGYTAWFNDAVRAAAEETE